MGLPLFLYFLFTIYLVDSLSDIKVDSFWNKSMYMLCIHCAIGFLDYYKPFLWRYKIFLPIFISIAFKVNITNEYITNPFI